MSKTLNNKLLSLKEENKKLKKLVQDTENEIKGIITKNQEESAKIKKMLENVEPALVNSNCDSFSQTKGSKLYLEKVYELESILFKLNVNILDISVQNIAISKKIERRNKKNKLLQDANLEYKDRIYGLVIEKVSFQEKILNQKILNETLLSHNLYMPSLNYPLHYRNIIKF